MVAAAEPVSTPADTARRRSSVRGLLLSAALVAAILAALAALVATHTLVPRIDRSILSAARPHDVWGPTQRFVDHIVEGMRPTHMLIALACASAAIAVRRRSVFPLVLAAACEATLGLGVLALKAAVGERDPHQDLVGGGSFPSGHTAQVLLTFGVIALLLRGRMATVLWVLTPFATTLIGAALILEGAHWPSDVVGGALLAGFVLLLARSACIQGRPRRSLFAGRQHSQRGRGGRVSLSPGEERSHHDSDQRSSRGRLRRL